jgi:L-cysteate sulfo-lyase
MTSFARLPLAALPTPLMPLPRLTRELGGPAVYVKRDDCTGLALGGNKARKLAFLMAKAREEGADHVVTAGAVQSNHVRQTAAAAAMLGMRCTGLLEHRIPHPSDEYLYGGNAFLDRLMGARLLHYPAGTDMNRAMQEIAAQIREQGRRPFVVPGGGSDAVGSLGYAECVEELLGQCRQLGIWPDWIVLPTGSGGTQAGLLAGLHVLRRDTRVLGISVKNERPAQEALVHRLACETLALMGRAEGIDRAAAVVSSDFVGAGYGMPTEAMAEAVALTARLEGLVLDPVYTGKAMAGLIHLARHGCFNRNAVVVFLHTGGAPSLFSYRDAFTGVSAAGAPGAARDTR